MKITQQLPTPVGNAASSHLVASCPIGLSYEELYLVSTAGTFATANMTNIKVIANSKPIQEYRTGDEVDLYNKFNKRTAIATNKILVIDFNRRLLKDRGACELTKLGTGKPANLKQFLDTNNTVPNPDYNPYPVQTLTFEMDLSSAWGATNAMSLFARLSAPAPTGLIRKVRPLTYGPTANPFEISDIPKGDMVNAIYMQAPGTTSAGLPTTGIKLTRAIVLRDNFKIFDRTSTLNSLIQTDDTVRTPQTNLFVIDTTETGNGAEVIATAGVNDFRLQLTPSTTPTGNFFMTVDYIGQLDR